MCAGVIGVGLSCTDHHHNKIERGAVVSLCRPRNYVSVRGRKKHRPTYIVCPIKVALFCQNSHILADTSAVSLQELDLMEIHHRWLNHCRVVDRRAEYELFKTFMLGGSLRYRSRYEWSEEVARPGEGASHMRLLYIYIYIYGRVLRSHDLMLHSAQ